MKRAFVAILLFGSCRNNPVAKNTAILSPAGKWRVVEVSETDFSIEGHDTLKGPFANEVTNESVAFKSDSILYYEPEHVSRYVYSRKNDSTLALTNVETKTVMALHINYLTQDSLSFTNVRTEEHRGNQYEVTIACKK